jgi:hypothetical protein
MALTPTEIELIDKIKIIRTKYNELVAAFSSFTFTGADLDIAGDLSVIDITVSGNANVTGLLRKGGVDVSLVGHTHDDRYFTETEITTNYYTKTQTATVLEDYYTETEIATVLEDYIKKDGSIAFTADIEQRVGTGVQGHAHYKYSVYTDASNYSRSFDKVENRGGTPIHVSGVEKLGTGTAMEREVQQNGHALKHFIYNAEVADDVVVTLPTLTGPGWGTVIAGDDEEHTTFFAKTDGTIILVGNSVNVVKNIGDDNKLCIGTSVANPILIANRLGSAKDILINFWYS